jgi:NitT/TauT family transport system permease protein
LHKHVLWADIADSLRRVAIGYGAAVVIGIPLGLCLGWFPAVNQVVNPLLQILRPISPIAWIPVAIIFFGIGDPAAIFLVFLGSFFPIVVACVGGVSSVPLIFRRAGRNFGLSISNCCASRLPRGPAPDPRSACASRWESLGSSSSRAK